MADSDSRTVSSLSSADQGSSPGGSSNVLGGSSNPSGVPSLLVVLGEAFSEEQQQLILRRLSNELLSWDVETSGCDLNVELQALAAKAPTGTDGQHGEKLIEYTSDSIQVTIVINPKQKTLVARLRTFLLAGGSYRHLVYAGQALQYTGCWILQDSVFTFSTLVDVFRGCDVCNAIKSGAVSGAVGVNVFAEGEWAHVAKLAPQLQINLNRPSQLADSNGVIQFAAYLSYFVKATRDQELLQSTNVVGNIRFNRPTLYIFPSAQGDSALFGISGFNLLVDGGFSRRACFWDFARHLDRIDALLVTHFGVDNLFGLGSVVRRKAKEPSMHPEIGYVYMNGCAGVKVPGAHREGCGDEASVGENGKEKHRMASESLLVGISHEASRIVDDLRSAGLTPRACTVTTTPTQPVNLYHKVGHGSLDMYVLNPTHDGKALKEFLAAWSKHSDGFTTLKGGTIPLSHQVSICALLVWKPASATEAITRILFTGASTQASIFEGLDRLKGVNLFQHPTCSEKELNAPAKSNVIRKPSTASKLVPPGAAKPQAAGANHGTIKAEPTAAAAVHQKPATAIPAAATGHAAGKSHVGGSVSKADVKESMKKVMIPKKEAAKPAAVTATSPTKQHAPKEAKPVNDEGATVAAPCHSDITSPNEAACPEAVPIEDCHEERSTEAVSESPAGNGGEQQCPDVSPTEPEQQACKRFSVEETITPPPVYEAVPIVTESELAGADNIQLCDEASSPSHEEVVSPDQLSPVDRQQPSEGSSPMYEGHDSNANIDMDKDIDTALDAEGNVQCTEDVAHGGHDEQIFDGECPKGLPQPCDEEQLIRTDSLENIPYHQHGASDELESAHFSSEQVEDDEKFNLPPAGDELSPSFAEPAPTNNLLDIASLQTDEQSNPFVGIDNMNTGEQGLGGGISEETSQMSSHHGIEGVAHGDHVDDGDRGDECDVGRAEDVDRDSLEREEQFDPHKQWGHPMGLPAPNKLPGASRSEHDGGMAEGGQKKGDAKKGGTALHVSKSSANAKPTNGKDQVGATGSASVAVAVMKDDSKVSLANDSMRKPPATLGKKGRPSTVPSGVDVHASYSKESRPDVQKSAPASATRQPIKKPAAGGATAPKAGAGLKPIVPFYVDLAYIPGHGSTAYADGDFFRRVRARYYVLSTVSPDPALLTALLDAKSTWEEHDAEVTIIPTYDAEVLRYWMGAHHDAMSQLKIDVAPSANRCSIQLQDHETGCAAYRLEF